MSAAPFMQLYVADYLGDTQHLTTEQHGAYLLLLMAMWRAGGRLPDDAVQLARIARMTPTRWRKTAPVVLAFFDCDAGFMEQKRLRREIEKASDISRKRASAGVRGAAAKALKTRTHSPEIAVGAANREAAFAGALPAHSQIQETDSTDRSVDEIGDGDLLDRLFAAGGTALRRSALADASEPLRWIAAGCDLSIDIVPVLRRRCRNRLPDSIHSWSYFADAVFEARDRRRGGQAKDAANGRSAARSPHDALAAGMARALGVGGDGEARRCAGIAAGPDVDGSATELAAGGSGAAATGGPATRG